MIRTGLTDANPGEASGCSGGRSASPPTSQEALAVRNQDDLCSKEDLQDLINVEGRLQLGCTVCCLQNELTHVVL